MYAPEIEAQERKHERNSAIITAVIVAILLLISFIWQVSRMRVPPPGAKEYEVLGAVDFGDYSQGSRNINNFQPPTPTPTQNSAQSSSADNSEAPASSDPAPSNEMTQPDIAPVSQPTPQPTPTTTPTPTNPTPPSPSTQPAPTPTPSTQTDASSSTQQQQQEEELEFDLGAGGSNDGDADAGTGNEGTPDIKILDPDGMYSFTDESGNSGTSGRRPLSLPNPRYESQQEGDLKFEFIIAPDGSVSYVKDMPNNKPALAEAGKAAIRQWRFNSKRGAAPQRVRVTIKFKLKG